jgi:hypothetical protein
MDTIIQSDIFFFVTTIFVAIVAIGTTIIIVYVIRILRDLRDISRIAKTETEHLAGDVEHLRADLKNKGFNLPSIFRFFRNIFIGGRRNYD